MLEVKYFLQISLFSMFYTKDMQHALILQHLKAPKVNGGPLSSSASLCELEITSFILLEVCSLALIHFKGQHSSPGNFQKQLVSGSCAWGPWGRRVP